jgi:hypothetical protein
MVGIGEPKSVDILPSRHQLFYLNRQKVVSFRAFISGPQLGLGRGLLALDPDLIKASLSRTRHHAWPPQLLTCVFSQ